MKKVLIIVGVIVVIIGTAVGIILNRVKKFDTYMEQVRIEDVDLSEIEDGSYTGVSDSGVIKVEVEVIVRSHRIEEIRLLKHRSGQGKDAEAIINDIVEQQKITVDTVSGATLSSRVIQDAVQKALLR